MPVSGKRLSYLLRHRPDAIGLVLDAHGRARLEDLVPLLAQHGAPTSRVELETLVQADDKGRFVIEGDHIRAAQGHSIPITPVLERASPPTHLHHGTSARVLPSIRERGLVRGARHHVHLSPDLESARHVAARRREPIVLTIRAAAMEAEGHPFYRSSNGVWLVLAVPPAFIEP